MKMKSVFGPTVIVLLLCAVPTLAQKPAAKMGMEMPEHCKKMMQMCQKMEGASKAQDAKLKTLMAAMDRASGEQKIKAMQAVITELIAQRNAHQAMMAQMQGGDKKSMMQCPMMGGGMGKGGMMGHDMSKMKSK